MAPVDVRHPFGVVRHAAHALLMLAAIAAAQRSSGHPENMELLRAALQQAIGQLLAQMPDSVGPVAVSVRPDSAALVRVEAEKALQGKGIPVTTRPDAPMHLSVTVRTMGVTIPRTRRRWPSGRREAQRRAEVTLSAYLRTADGATIWAADARGQQSDWLPASALAQAEGPNAYGCAPTMPEERWIRIAEPLFVMGTLTFVLYLFFTK